MRKLSLILFFSLFAAFPSRMSPAQGSTGALEFQASVTPTAAKPEPVRDFTFYVLTKSYRNIVKEINEKDGPPSRETFIEGLKVSPELKHWLTKHDVIDLTLPGIDKLLTPDDILKVPEFLQAYQHSNSGGVTPGFPHPKYHEADKQKNPLRYQKQHDEYMASLKKFIQAHPESVTGIEMELDDVNPARQWAELQSRHKRKVSLLAPTVAQTKFLATKVDTDLDGHAMLTGLPPGNYWISSLGLYAESGDVRLSWDVPVRIEAGRTTRLQLTNLNSVGMDLEKLN